MHMRRKGVKRTEEKFYVGEEEIAVVEEYKYLGCVVDDYGQVLYIQVLCNTMHVDAHSAPIPTLEEQKGCIKFILC